MTEIKTIYEIEMQSPSISTLAKAIVKAQAEMPSAKFNAINPFFKSSYADLGSVIEAARPTLAKHGLAVIQPVITGRNGTVGVRTTLIHESGEYISTDAMMPVLDSGKQSLAQVAGITITYLRRYALSSLLGIYADEDTDANKDTETKGKKEDSKKKTTKKNGRPLTPAKLKKGLNTRAAEIAESDIGPLPQSAIGAVVGNLEMCFSGDEDSTEKRHSVTAYVFGETSFKELTSPQILALKRWLNATEDSGGEWLPNKMAIKEAKAVVKAHMKKQGQEELI